MNEQVISYLQDIANKLHDKRRKAIIESRIAMIKQGAEHKRISSWLSDARLWLALDKTS